jgi:predicted metal-dependent hydrolase
VNRVLSNRESRRTPPRPARRPSSTGPAAPPKGGPPAGAPAEPKRKRAIRKVRAARKRKGAKVVVELAPSARVDEVTVWLKRDGKVLAAATKRVRGKKRAALTLRRSKRLRKGLYEIDVMATERDGEQSHRRARTRLR